MGLYVSSSQCGFFSASRWNESSSSWVAMISSTADVPDSIACRSNSAYRETVSSLYLGNKQA